MPFEQLFEIVPEGWEYVTLGKVVADGGGHIQTGPFGSQLHAADYVLEGVPSIMPTNIGDNRINEEGIARIRQEDADRLKRFLVAEGDIVYSRRGDIEKRALIRKGEVGWLCGTGCLLIRLGDQGADPLFMSYYLGDPVVREWLVRHAQGATMLNLNTGILGKVPVLLPPKDEQKEIASILGALDDKIELNRRMNATLEAMAQALFKEWFVDRSSAVGAKKEWEEVMLDEIADYRNGLALQKFRPQEGEDALPVVKIAQMRTGLPDSGEWASPTIGPEFILEDGDVVFSWSGSLMAILWCGGKAALNQHLFKVTSDKYPKWFYYLWTQYHMPEFRAIASHKATTMGHINRNHLKVPVRIPPPQLLERGDHVIAPLLDRIVGNNLENRTLASLRDTLLPKLMRGEVRVRELANG